MQFADPVSHMHRQSAHGLAFCEDEILLDQIIERGEFCLIQIVLGDGDVNFAELCAAPIGEAHVRFGAVGTGVNNFRCGLAGDGPVHFVLHGLEEFDALRLRGVVVDAGGVDVGDRLIKPPFGSADILNPPQQFIEVVERAVGILQAFVIEDEALHDEFAQLLRGSDAETGGDGAFYAVADGDDGVEVIEIGAVSLSVSGSCKEILYN